jgi:rubrerythrin
MGMLHDFKCPTCDYYAEVAGGADTGMMVSTVTITCLDCRELYDAVTHDHTQEGYPVFEPEPPEPVPVCPKNEAPRVEEWTAPGSCPKCGTAMAMGDMVCLWD